MGTLAALASAGRYITKNGLFPFLASRRQVRGPSKPCARSLPARVDPPLVRVRLTDGSLSGEPQSWLSLLVLAQVGGPAPPGTPLRTGLCERQTRDEKALEVGAVGFRSQVAGLCLLARAHLGAGEAALPLPRSCPGDRSAGGRQRRRRSRSNLLALSCQLGQAGPLGQGERRAPPAG